MWKYIVLFFLAMSPVLELRGTLVISVLLKMPLIYTIPVAIAGNTLAVALVFLYLPRVVTWAERHFPWFHRLLQRIFARTRKEHSHRAVVFGEVALVLFVAIPIPGTGAWTAALLVYLFDLPKQKAFWLITLGLILSAAIILGILWGSKELFDLLVEIYRPSVEFLPGVLQK